jgi:5-formyltetrahydrofolate cyclo-ligase
MLERRELGTATQAEASVSISRLVSGQVPFRAITIAAYLAERGELDLLPTIRLLVDRGVQIVLPVCGPSGSMEFCPWSEGDDLSLSKFGIGEPRTMPVTPASIDVFLVPGVGFARDGSRVGHGAGYYDRFFARCFAADHDPLRIGIAHDLQIVDLPPSEPWDVAMHQVITPTQVIQASG